MSVDTYLKGKTMTRYQAVDVEGVRVLIAPLLAQQARSIHLDVSRFLLWRSFAIEAEPLADHFHSRSCAH